MAALVTGPLLRYVDRTSATVWVETDAPCEVAVETDGGGPSAAEHTWEVSGHHYALAVLRGLDPGTSRTYRVLLGGEPVWPRSGSPFPPSRIRTLPAEDGARPLRLSFGSCRWASPPATAGAGLAPDALDTLAQRLAADPGGAEAPDALLLLGDQIYADETSEPTRRWLAGRRDLDRPPYGQVADFEEYTHLYHESWRDPQIRWLLSTVPSCMVFDDHDVIDDWNTSAAWRRDMAATDWWAERITGGFVSYWIYQHLGNLSPDDLQADAVYAAVRAHDGDAAPLLREHARRADAEADLRCDPPAEPGPGSVTASLVSAAAPPEHGDAADAADAAGRPARGGDGGGATEPAAGGPGLARGEDRGRIRWSYRRDFGRVRLLVIDSRAGRVLTEGRRGMVSDEEMRWIAAQTADGDFDHLLVGSSLPWLLPRAIHDLESWSEALTAGRRGSRWAARAERLRRVGDLEHWAAFRRSFDALADLIALRGRGGPGEPAPPATIAVLSGDVHHAYLAEARYPPGAGVRSRVVQLTCSPVHNSVPPAIRLGFRFGWGRTARVIGRLLDRHAGLPPTPIVWDKFGGPWFGNLLMTLTLHGRAARLALERAERGARGRPGLRRLADVDLGE